MMGAKGVLLYVAVLCNVADVYGSNKDNCTLPDNKNHTLHVHTAITSALNTTLCEVNDNFTAKHPDVGIQYIDLKEFSYNHDNDFAFLQNMLYNKETGYEVMSLDTPWVTTLQDELIELDINPNIIRKKWQLHMSPNGKLYTLTRQTNQMVVFYRKDLFDKHGLTYPATWEEFETTLDTLVKKERAGGNTDFDGVLLPTDSNSQNRIIYMLVTLMSGFDGAGNVVDDSGNVTVNNPAAARTLTMWKRWVGTIAPHNLWGLTSGGAKTNFLAGKSACLILWSSDSTVMNQANIDNSSLGWDIQIGPIPGNNGAGCSGDWSIGINKHTPLKEAAQDLVSDLSEHFSFFDLTGNEPARQDVMDRPDFWVKFNSSNPMLAKSMQAYPEFWDRLVHRPSAGCKELYGDCVNIVFKHVTSFFLTEGQTGAEAVAAMEKDLHVLFGVIDISGIDYSRDEWTDTRVAMVVISLCCGVFLVGIVWMIVRGARSLCNDISFKVPVSVMLGVVALTSFAVVLGVVVTRNDTAIRDISEDLSERLRQQSMLALEISIHGTIESLVEKNSATFALLMSRVLGNIKQDIARMRVPARSLIVLIDRTTRKVLLSNDDKQQPVGTVLSGIGAVSGVAHPWVSGALASIENWNTSLIDPERSYLYSSGGEKVYASMLNIKKAASDVEAKYLTYSIDWLLVYITPHVVIMGDAEDAYEEAIDLSVMLAAIGIVVLLACAVVITQPFISLVRDMKHVENMEMDKVVKRDSILLEVSALLSGFYAMCDILNEYKAYMPASLFQKDESSDVDEESLSKTSRSSRTATSHHTGDTPAPIGVVSQMKMQATTKSISLVSIWYPGDSVGHVTTILDAVSGVTSGGGRGALLSTTGDQSIIGLNITTHLVSHNMKACQCAVMVRDRLGSELGKHAVGIGCATGKATVASCGSLALKAFTALGKVMPSVRYLSERGCTLKAGVMLENSVALVVKGCMEVEPVTVYALEHKRSGSDQVIFRAGSFLETENEEWMYAYARNATDANSVASCMAHLTLLNSESNKKQMVAIEAAWSTQGTEMAGYLADSLQDLRSRFCH